MYKITKAQGHNVSIFIENTDTGASINIGRITMEVLNIMEKAGYRKDDEPKLRDEWNINIDETTAKALQGLTMKMKPPVRVNTKDKAENEKKQKNKTIDAMDVLLGLASYN